jgi:tight adherence protein B
MTSVLLAVDYQTADTGSAFWSHSWVLVVGTTILFVGLVTLLVLAMLTADTDGRRNGRLRRRLSKYGTTAAPVDTAKAGSGSFGNSAVARSAVDFADRVVQKRDFDSVLAKRLESAGLPLKPAEWLLIHVGLAIGLTLVMLLFFDFRPVPALIGLGVGVLLPLAYLTHKEVRRKNQFADNLPDTLQLIAGSLAAGYSLLQAVDTVVRESEGAISSEFGRALVEARLGVPVEDALDSVALRMGSQDFEWVVMAIRIQREVGGNLTEVLHNVSATLRDRARLHRQVRALSAEGRLSAVILVGLPILVGAFFGLFRPDYIRPLFTTAVGLAMFVLSVGLLIAGGLWLRKIVDVEV